MRKFCTFRHKKHPGHQIDEAKREPPHTILSKKQLAQRTDKEYRRL
jgi:hypothetical protein